MWKDTCICLGFVNYAIQYLKIVKLAKVTIVLVVYKVIMWIKQETVIYARIIFKTVCNAPFKNVKFVSLTIFLRMALVNFVAQIIQIA